MWHWTRKTRKHGKLRRLLFWNFMSFLMFGSIWGEKGLVYVRWDSIHARWDSTHVRWDLMNHQCDYSLLDILLFISRWYPIILVYCNQLHLTHPPRILILFTFTKRTPFLLFPYFMLFMRYCLVKVKAAWKFLFTLLRICLFRRKLCRDIPRKTLMINCSGIAVLRQQPIFCNLLE